jgi:hypothetical protein
MMQSERAVLARYQLRVALFMSPDWNIKRNRSENNKKASFASVIFGHTWCLVIPHSHPRLPIQPHDLAHLRKWKLDRIISRFSLVANWENIATISLTFDLMMVYFSLSLRLNQKCQMTKYFFIFAFNRLSRREKNSRAFSPSPWPFTAWFDSQSEQNVDRDVLPERHQV